MFVFLRKIILMDSPKARKSIEKASQEAIILLAFIDSRLGSATYARREKHLTSIHRGLAWICQLALDARSKAKKGSNERDFICINRAENLKLKKSEEKSAGAGRGGEEEKKAKSALCPHSVGSLFTINFLFSRSFFFLRLLSSSVPAATTSV